MAFLARAWEVYYIFHSIDSRELFHFCEACCMQNAPQPGQDQRLRADGQADNPYQTKLPQPGEKIGPNRIEQLIGEGGMASVYKIWNEGLEVVRAIKVLKRPMIKEARERFLTEAKILANIRHQNIVEIFSIGLYEQQAPFIEMEFVDGVSIKKLLAQHSRLSLPAALAIGYSVCMALHYAHTKDYTLYGNIYHGLIHRDIKPDNIVVGKDGLIKLMDFGIARPSEVSLHTVGAKIMGTLVYLSPEQLNGMELDHRSDIFSMGAVLYEMVTGQRAFPQKTLSELVQAKTKGQYAPLSSHGVQVPQELDQAVSKAMALDVQERYDTAADLGRALYELLHDMTDLAPQEIVQRYINDPAAKIPPPRKKHGSGAAAVIIGILSGLVVALGATVAFLLLK
jgi:eukaryotic-like serine/threonine-protein kinase